MVTVMVPIDFSQYRNIVILTGAGVSVASGIRPFRGPDGVWDDWDVERCGTVQALHTNPLSVWKLFGPLRTQLAAANPNPAHFALAELEARLKPDQQFTLITQNIDGLHQQAGSRNVIELHGTVHRTRCSRSSCRLKPYLDGDPHDQELARCPECGSPLRIDIVLFGEAIPAEAAWLSNRALRNCDLFIAAGTSGMVYPAADFVRAAQASGARTALVNLEPVNPPNPYFNDEYLGRAEEVLPFLLSVR